MSDLAPVITAELLSDEECDSLINSWDEENKETGTVFYGDDLLESDVRSGELCWLEFHDHQAITDKIVEVLVLSNTDYFQLELAGCRDRLQLSKYSKGDYYDWHVDAGDGDSQYRSLSFSIQLSDPKDYEGGDMEFPENTVPRKRGNIIIFPSVVRHRITEVTAGERYSLVGWICRE